jgi:hypothetical protein
LRELAHRLRFWQWKLAGIQCDGLASGEILFMGTERTLARALEHIGANSEASTPQVSLKKFRQAVLISDFPTPGAYRVPVMLNTVVPLGRPLNEIAACYGSNLRRLIRQQRQEFSVRQISDDSEIEAVNRNMLRTFASARHGKDANQLCDNVIVRMAKSQCGRLDAICLNEEVVACHLGSSFVRSGKTYWSSVRFGYPEAVLSDSRQFGETNAMVSYLALEWAVEHGFDHYSIGFSTARPDGGLLQWKKRRAGVLDAKGYYGLLYIRLPKQVAHGYLWIAPFFSMENGGIALHLGVPDSASDEAVLDRYRKMSYRGLSRICLHSGGTPREGALDKIRSLYSPQECPPVVLTE